MEQNKFLKIFALVAFIAFAAISCWATAESLHFSLPNWPVPACWIISVGFFVIASIGTTMIVNSLNQRVEVEHRGWVLVGGLVMTLIFWLVCSMPTNTHTFFYRSKINNVVTDDMGTTIKYLDQLAKAQKVTDSIEKEYKDTEHILRGLKIDLEEEIKNHWNRGVGPNARAIMSNIERVSGREIKELSKSQNPKSEAEGRKLAEVYGEKVTAIINEKEAEKNRIISDIIKNTLYVKKAKTDLNELQNADLAIQKGELSLIKADEMKALTDKLQNGYKTIKDYKQWVSFSSQKDRDLYSSEKLVTKTDRMIDVFSVWKDFLQGGYRGHGLWYWVVIAILVDVAAFIFFNITFAKRDDA